MPIYKLRGIEVDFPFEAYPSQIIYMEKVIQSLQQGCNALLESPTGMGKTLCLLCATLAWRRTFGEFLTRADEVRDIKARTASKADGAGSQPLGRPDFPLIIYTSRTHSQLKLVIGELKVTNYRCPYYVSRELHKVVDIIFAPYNYLIDPANRSALSDIKWNSTILIFDEAHNLESICADAASFDLPSGYLPTCISEAQKCMELCIARREAEESNDKKLDPDHYAILKVVAKGELSRGDMLRSSPKAPSQARTGPILYISS